MFITSVDEIKDATSRVYIRADVIKSRVPADCDDVSSSGTVTASDVAH